MGDRSLGVIGIILSAVYVYAALDIHESFIQDPLGPKAFPILIASLFAIASLFMLLKPKNSPEWPELNKLIELAFAAALLFAYSFMLPILGFSLASAITAGYLSWRLGAEPHKAVIAGIVIAGGLYILFRLVLGLSLARGFVGF